MSTTDPSASGPPPHRTPQEIFDIAVGKLLEQGCKSFDNNIGCALYGREDTGDDEDENWQDSWQDLWNGRRCALGWLIPPDRYHPGLEGKDATVPEVQDACRFTRNEEQLANALMDMHDCWPIYDWPRVAEKIAQRFGLDPGVVTRWRESRTS